MKLINKIIILTITIFIASCGGGDTVKKGRKGPDLKRAAKLNVQIASGFIKQGKLEFAQEKLQKAIEQDDEYVPAYTTMAILKELLGEIDEAESYYLEALDINSKSPELHNNYGAFLCKHDKHEEAIKELTKALNNRFYETPEKVHTNLGYCLLKGDNPDYKKSEYHLRKALQMQPRNVSALLTMGELAIETKRFLMARAYMQRYHAIANPTSTSLWYQLQAEKALGDDKHYIELSQKLLKHFPDSDEANQLMEMPNK